MIPGLSLVEKNICERIRLELDSVGLLYRLFSRCKDERSIKDKIERKKEKGQPYSPQGKLIQDIIGIRIVTYFRDDVDLVAQILRDKFFFVDSEIDTPDPTVFKPKRTNIICRFDDGQDETFQEVKSTFDKDYFLVMDNTFELQLRTILSEGWHEIDHSLRYKSQADWLDYPENERLLNGIYASLETNDIALKNLFNELSYKHFKNRNWEGLIKNKFRLRFQITSLDQSLIDIFNDKPELGKALYKIEREELLLQIYRSKLNFPLQLSTLVYLANALIIKDKDILEVTPSRIKDFL